MPVRKIRANHRSITGRVVSVRDSRPHPFESALERDFLVSLDFDRRVASFETQPLRVEYEDAAGRLRTYTPDVFVQFVPDMRSVDKPPALLYEVKYAAEITQRRKELDPKFDAAREFARTRGWGFEVVTEDEIRNPFLFNAIFLRPLIREPIEDVRMRRVMSLMHDLVETCPEELVTATCLDTWNRAEVVRLVWQLLASTSKPISLFASR